MSFSIMGCIPEIGKIINDSSNTPMVTQASPLQFAEVIFTVEVPQQTPTGQKIYLDILDDVTGLGLNPLRYTLGAIDQNHYAVHIPIPLGSIVKYRFSREGNPPAIEFTAAGEQVRYRMFYVSGPSEILDYVSAWNDMPYEGPVGRIEGKVTDISSDLPIPNVMISAGGASTITASDGSYLLEGMSLGTHNIVAYSLDGTYNLYQQGAVVAAESATPAPIRLTASTYVNVSFIVKSPANSVDGVPVRMVGNIYSLGNTFADLDGGVNNIAARAPLLTFVEDGYYTITLHLPVGLDLRYKYTLGDGFWNAEHSSDGTFTVRQLIIPDHDTVIEDQVETWNYGNSAPVTFSVIVPENTPSTDTVSIQFNPYAWMEPIPMWPLGDNKWLYILYSPIEMVGNVTYRYCRNDQCDNQSDSISQGDTTQSYYFTNSKDPQSFNDQIHSWPWWSSNSELNIETLNVIPRSGTFIAGIELKPEYNPSFQPYMGNAFQDIADTGAGYVVLTPTWSYTRQNLPVLRFFPGKNQLWPDTLQMSDWAQQRNLNVIFFPMNEFYLTPANEWWIGATRDTAWWQSWCDRYHTFIINNADLASQVGAKAIIIGDPRISPALPNGKLSNGISSGVPGDVENYWRQLIVDIRSHFSGLVIWTITYPVEIETLPSFISDVDMVYILFSAPLSDKNDASVSEIAEKVGILLDDKIIAIKNQTNKPVMIGLNYPSMDGAAIGCINKDGNCITFNSFDQDESDFANASIDLQEQADIYEAVFLAASQRDWITGLISRSYYSPVALMDKSFSIHGKPAEKILKTWFPLFNNATNQ